MEKKYTVFVSSTYEDLKEERQEVMQALLEMDCIPCGMEVFPAASEEQFEFIKSMIDNCDYYVLILAGRYGSTNSNGISYTELEFRYALEKNIPIISFVYKDIDLLPNGKCEHNKEGIKKLKKFQSLVESRMCKFWTNKDQLSGFVSRSMMQLIRKCPAIGWTRIDCTQLEDNTEVNINNVKKLKKRSKTIIQDYLQSAKHDVFISGIINNGVINFFMNNSELLENCAQRNIKIRILFYVADNEQCFDWYLKMMYGFEDYENKIKSDKALYNTHLSFINTYEVFTNLLRRKLLEFKRINSPITTAFVAKDIDQNINSSFETNGQIQCLFYQFKIDSPDCPAYIVDHNDEMFSAIKNTISDMWESATKELKTSYLKSY